MVFTAFFRTATDADSCLSSLLGRSTTKVEYDELLDIELEEKGKFHLEDKPNMQTYQVSFDKCKKMLRLDVQELPLPF